VKVVIDVETKKTFSDIDDWDPSKLGISFVGLYRNDTDEYLSFWEDDLPKMWPILESAEEIIGYNLIGFDYPALKLHYPGDIFRLPTLDLLKVVQDSLGHRIKLDKVAVATLGRGKIGNGLDAVRYWRNKELDKLEKYCLEDVRVTWDVYQYAKKYGKLYYLNGLNDKSEFRVIWPQQEKVKSIQTTLGI